MKKIITTGFISVAILMIAAFIFKLRAGSTPPILDEQGQPLPVSIASLEKIELGGMEQWLLMRGESTSNPVLLWLHGGPGAAQMPVARSFNGALEEHFIVVHWDQRGAGKSNPANFDESSMTFQQYLDDAHDLTLYLKSRFGKEKIYLLGHSWGSQIGIKLAQAYPQDYYAFIGVSQVVAPALAQQVAYEWLTDQIKAQESEKDRDELEELGKPPYREHGRYVKFVKLVDAYGGDFDASMAKLAWVTFQAPEYSLGDMLAWLDGANRGSGPMWDEPAYQSFNAFEETLRLDVPVYFLNGALDYNTPASLTQQYFNLLEAPRGKHLVIFESSAHTPFLGEAEKFNEVLVGIKREIEMNKK
jgi:pimeloyl-ACP methyl ester carboxylesterase